MITQVLVYPKGVEGCGVESCKEHVYHNKYVYLAVLHPQRHILVVVGKFVCRCVVVGLKHLVVVGNGFLQKITAALVKSFC